MKQLVNRGVHLEAMDEELVTPSAVLHLMETMHALLNFDVLSFLS